MVLKSVQNLIAERLECKPEDITEATLLENLGLDSLDVVEMLMELGDQLGKDIELTEKVTTVGEFVSSIEKKLNEEE